MKTPKTKVVAKATRKPRVSKVVCAPTEIPTNNLPTEADKSFSNGAFMGFILGVVCTAILATIFASIYSDEGGLSEETYKRVARVVALNGNDNNCPTEGAIANAVAGSVKDVLGMGEYDRNFTDVVAKTVKDLKYDFARGNKDYWEAKNFCDKKFPEPKDSYLNEDCQNTYLDRN